MTSDQAPAFWTLGVPELFSDAELLTALGAGDRVALGALSTGLAIFNSNPELRRALRHSQEVGHPDWIAGVLNALGRADWSKAPVVAGEILTWLSFIDTAAPSMSYVEPLLKIVALPDLTASSLSDLQVSLGLLGQRHWQECGDAVIAWFKDMSRKTPEFWVPRLAGLVHLGKCGTRFAEALSPLIQEALGTPIRIATHVDGILYGVSQWGDVLDTQTAERCLAEWVPAALNVLDQVRPERCGGVIARPSLWLQSTAFCDGAFLLKKGYNITNAPDVVAGLSPVLAQALLRQTLIDGDTHEIDCLCRVLDKREDRYTLAADYTQQLMFSESGAARTLGWLAAGHTESAPPETRPAPSRVLG